MSTAIEPAPAVRTVSSPAADDSPSGSRFSWLRSHARSAGLLAFVVLSFVWFGRTWIDPLQRHVGAAGDPESYIFALSWPPFALLHHLNPLHTTYVLDPTGFNLMWTVPPGFGVLLWPLTATIGVIPTYNLLATLSLAASAWTAQLALRRFAPGELGPFVGGLFYGFSPYMTAHSSGHAMLTVAVLPALLLLLVHEAAVRQRWRVAWTGIAIGALIAFQLSTFLELVAGGAIAAGLLLIMLAVTYRREVRRRISYFATAIAIAVPTFLVLGGFQLWMLAFGPQSLLHVNAYVHPPNVVVTDLAEFVVPTQYNVAGSAFSGLATHFTALGPEANGYIGVPLLAVLLVIVVRHWRSHVVRFATVFTLLMAVLSMGPRLHFVGPKTFPLPWALFAHLPLMGNLLPTRLAVFTDLGIAVLLAYGIGHRVRPPTRKLRLVRTIAVVAVVASLLPSATLLSLLSAPTHVPSYFTSNEVKRIPKDSVVLVAPWTTDARNDLPQVWQAVAGFRYRMPSGYAYVPNGNGGLRTGIHEDRLERALYRMDFGFAPRANPADPAMRAELLGDLARHRIETVIVGPMLFRAPVLRFFTTLLGRRPEHTGGVYVWYRVGGDAGR